jgi:two-component system cell cycle sensor histidine kinase PleC
MQADKGDTCILVVDDDPVVTEVTQRTLSRAGWPNVIVTNDPAQVVALTAAHRPHVILLDRHMPGIDGFAVLRDLGDLRVSIGISVLMLTADSDRNAVVEALESGAQDFITKPFRAPELLARVAVAAEIQQLRRLQLDRNASLEDAVRKRTARLEAAISILKAAEEKLKEALSGAETERYRLIANTVHELRTPLNGILGFAQLVADEIKGPILPSIYRDYAGNIVVASEHMAALIDRLLDLARPSSPDEAAAHFEPVDLPALLSESVDLLMPQADEAKVTLIFNARPGIEAIETDAIKVRQIVLNLVSNALKFTPAGGRVAVELGPDGDGGAYILVVRDNGIGIKPDDLERVMKPFGQVGAAQAGRKKGTGLGMPLTKLFVEQLGGTLLVESEYGSGTIVTVRLPRRPALQG